MRLTCVRAIFSLLALLIAIAGPALLLAFQVDDDHHHDDHIHDHDDDHYETYRPAPTHGNHITRSR